MVLKSIAIQIYATVCLILLFGVFCNKQKQRSLEGSLYKTLLIFTFFVLFFDIASNVCIVKLANDSLVSLILSKAYLISIIHWCYWLMVYVVSLNNEKGYLKISDLFDKEKIMIISFVACIILSVISLFLDLNYSYNAQKFSISLIGTATLFTFLICIFFMGFMTIYMIYNPKKLSFNKRIPIFVFSFLGLSAIVIEWIFSYYYLVSSVMTFVMMFIYFTMENPDLKIINELEKGKEEIEEVSKAKSDFLSNMSHDIRTPMNAIIGFSESLLMEELRESQKEEVKNIHDAATTLLQIINNILDISRIESGKEEKQEKEYSLSKLISSLTNIIGTKIDNQKIKLNVNVNKNVPDVLYGDEVKVYQILMNLLSNAAKYTKEGYINFDVSADNIGDQSRIKFIVSDSGIGIKEEDYKKMFVKFSRIHNAENYESIEGTGLGLAITKSLVTLLDGTINFQSTYGKGTTFVVTLPQRIGKQANDSSIINHIDENQNVQNFHFDGSLYDILIVDDNNLNLKVAERILSDYKFNITLVSSGNDCIDLLKSGRRFDLIFLDHMMPIKDGIETLHEIRALENVKIPPIIALTANAMVGMKEMFLSEGFDGYISKPINRDELQTTLNHIFCKK